jgi:hypothetical protein
VKKHTVKLIWKILFYLDESTLHYCYFVLE